MKTFQELYEKSTPAELAKQRRAKSRAMSKLNRSSANKAKKARARLKVKSPAKLALLARKQTIQMFRNKLYPNYNDMPIPKKIKIDQLIMQKYGKKIDALSRKKIPIMKKADLERVLKAKENKDA
tara:strand:+ start:21 stop:395 length:375 start_codon:yes stop_codon:yes gene_type:complete